MWPSVSGYLQKAHCSIGNAAASEAGVKDKLPGGCAAADSFKGISAPVMLEGSARKKIN
jgi:hypothetical protein